ncbi:8339_t:CDS:2 [Paraglomus occultum]|uniref:8339_t:CDS:1 n=1 Tax=Paraglomus occultum TaxID=144539 RepID=A0A9N8ZE79_9GLOM|nr:8339_t:CDS:2 [Paraglomus occultum]
MPVNNSNVVKPMSNTGRFGPQPGGGILTRTTLPGVNPGQQVTRPLTTPYPPSVVLQRPVGGATALNRTNGRLATLSLPMSSSFKSYSDPSQIMPIHSQKLNYPSLSTNNPFHVGSNAPSWNYTSPATTLNQSLSLRQHQQPFSQYPNSLSTDDFPALVSSNTSSTTPATPTSTTAPTITGTSSTNATSAPNAISSSSVLNSTPFPSAALPSSTNIAPSSTLGSTYATTASTAPSSNGSNAGIDGRLNSGHPRQSQEFSIDEFPALPNAASNNRLQSGGHTQNVDGLTHHPNGLALGGVTAVGGVSGQDWRLGLGSVRSTTQPSMNSVSEQDKKAYLSKPLVSSGVTMQNATSVVSNMQPYILGSTPSQQQQPSQISSSNNPSSSSPSQNPLSSSQAPSQVPSPSPTSQQGQMIQTAQTTQQSSSLPQSQSVLNDKYGLLGLLDVIRMSNEDLTMLALGNDLATLGLNLDSSDALYATFTSPWSDASLTPGLIEPEYHLPPCYNVQPPPPAHEKIASFSDETLFYIFYSMPRDILQEYAAQELYNRNWRYHREHRLWLTKELGTEPITKTATYESGTYIFFDPTTWEKVKKETILMYELLEGPPLLPSIPSAFSQQGGGIQQGLSGMNMANLMGLGGIPNTIGGSGLGLGGPQLQLHHQYASGGQHLGGPLPGLASGGHYAVQGGMKEF